MSFFYEAISYGLVQHIMDISCTDSFFIMTMQKESTQFNGLVCILMGIKLINVHGLNSLLFVAMIYPLVQQIIGITKRVLPL